MFFQSLAEFPYFLIGEIIVRFTSYHPYVLRRMDQSRSTWEGDGLLDGLRRKASTTFGGCLKTKKKCLDLSFSLFPQEFSTKTKSWDHAWSCCPSCSLTVFAFSLLTSHNFVYLFWYSRQHGRQFRGQSPNFRHTPQYHIVGDIKYPQCHGRSLYNLQFKAPWFNR